jgi:hypothetical protein
MQPMALKSLRNLLLLLLNRQEQHHHNTSFQINTPDSLVNTAGYSYCLKGDLAQGRKKKKNDILELRVDFQ